MKNKPIIVYFVFTLLVELAVLLLLILTPSDIENQFFLGLSRSRWILIILVSLCVGFSGFGLYAALAGKLNTIPFLKTIETPNSFISISTFLLSLLGLGFIALMVFPGFFPVGVAARLQPVLWMMVLIVWGYSFYNIFYLKNQPWRVIAKFFLQIKAVLQAANLRILPRLSKFDAGYWYLLLIGIICAPLLFFVAAKFNFPSGYAGLYALMAEVLGESGFKLPQTVPYYGPGGLPFAYPPVGIYLMAVFTQLFHMPAFIYLRFAPPVFLLISLIPLALLIFELTRSRIAAILGAVIVAGSQRIFVIQGTSGGVVRGLAFLFALWGIYYFYRAYCTQKVYDAALAGLFIGLAGLTHLGYAEFAVLFVVAVLLTSFFKKRVWKSAIIAGIIAVFIAFPWISTMVHRYGWSVFLGAFQSHGNDSFLMFLREPQRVILWIENSLIPIYQVKFLWGMMLLALCFALFKAPVLPVWFGLLLLFTSESDRYLITVGAIAISWLFHVLYRYFNTPEKPVATTWRSISFAAIILIIFYVDGWQTISRSNTPLISADSLKLAEFVQSSTSPSSRYLMITQPEEAEWFPYLTRRVPVIASWGSEWTGTYAQHLGWVFEIANCQKQQSYECVNQILTQLPTQPDLLITHTNDSLLNAQIRHETSWQELTSSDAYVLWGKSNPH